MDDDNYSPNTEELPGATFGTLEDLFSSTYAHHTNFEPPSNFLELNDWIDYDDEGHSFSQFPGCYYNPIFTRVDEVDHPLGSGSSSFCPHTRVSESNAKEIRDKVAFKTRSEIEILDDGFKWRKYGKKMVKSNINPRNYYKCSVEGCSVKKRVERDNKDPNFVVTTYEGIHNHQGPLL